MASYDSVLNFARKLLKNSCIDTYVADFSSLVNQDLDMGLRKKIATADNIWEMSLSRIKDAPDNTLFFARDCFYCHYTFFKLPHTSPQLYFVAGPYMLRSADNKFFLQVSQELSLPREYFGFMKKYYECLPFIEYEDNLRSILLLLAAEIFGGPEKFTVSHRNVFPDNIQDHYYASSSMEPDNREMLEERYQTEEELMQAVTSGNLMKIELFSSGEKAIRTEKRLANRIRDSKNYLIILNTLLRKAAQYGGVHPLYLDDISSAFARRIEQITSEDEDNRLKNEMMRKYCLLVKTYSLKGYSPIMQKVINYINLYLTNDLSLKALSEKFSISSSYLSTLFRKETGVTLTDYVNKKRVEHALLLLNSTDMQIQNIAASCGIADMNYFTRIFKKHMGMTPSEYRTLIQRK